MATQFPMEAHRERLGWWAGPSRPTSLIVITTPEDTVHIQTAAVQTLRDHEHGAVIPPVHLASTYELDPRTDDGLYAYQRGGNPTRVQLEQVLAGLDGRSEERRVGKEADGGTPHCQSYRTQIS